MRTNQNINFRNHPAPRSYNPGPAPCPTPCPPPMPPCPVAASFILLKRDSSTNAPLANAEYGLYQNGQLVSSYISNKSGELIFDGIETGEYLLSEIQAPPGYQESCESYKICVDKMGCATINGKSANGCSLYNTPLIPLSFCKYDSQTGKPLKNVGFCLSTGITAVSDHNGLVNFGVIPPGSYTMEENQHPAGYLPNTHVYQINIPEDGTITIDSVPLEEFTICNTRQSTFFFIKHDAILGTPLCGAVFQLSNGITATSNQKGIVDFGALAPGEYTMQETTPPSGYLPNKHIYHVCALDDGKITVDGTDLSEFSLGNTRQVDFCFEKQDVITGQPLSGAAFCLSTGQKAVSNEKGIVTFQGITPGCYTMEEITAPSGYLPDTNVYHITVCPSGDITVNGVNVCRFTIYNTPYTTFCFVKYNAYTNQPLQGAQFCLSTGATATSDSLGIVDFGVLSPGSYSMTETEVPPGYQLCESTYNIVVSENGCITVDGKPLHEFCVSNMPCAAPEPCIYTIWECDTLIQGEGEPGCIITVLFPDSTTAAALVNEKGGWCLTVPPHVCLYGGDIIYANQTLAGSPSSDYVYQIILRHTTAY